MSWYGPLLKRLVWPPLLLREGRGSALAHEARFRESQYWPRQKLLDDQWEKLRTLLALASEHSPYYRRVFEERGLTPASFKSPADLVLLPRLTRATIFAEEDGLKTGLHPGGDVMKFATGGTSIRAATLYRDQESYNIKLGLSFRHEAWAGRRPGGRMLLYWPASMDFIEDPPWRTRFKDRYLLGERIVHGGVQTPEHLRHGFEVLVAYRPDMLKVFPNSLSPFADYFEAHGLETPPIRGILSTGEPLYPETRAKFERLFDCPVFDLYASREVGHSSCECEAHDGRHIAMETSILEFVGPDDQALPAGVRGDILVTDLTNTAFPLIRYEIGDRGFALEGNCSCGRELARMGSAVGRSADEIFLASGQVITGHAFGRHVLARDDVGEIQVIQRSVGAFHLLITDDPPPSPKAIEGLIAGTKKLVGEQVEVSIEIVSEIPRERSGKKRYVKCELSPEEIARLRSVAAAL